MQETPVSSAASRGVSRAIRRMLGTTAVFGVAILASLSVTGASYALWNAETVVNASTVSSGNVGLTVNGTANFAIPSLDATRLGPGQSVTTPLTLTNTGTTPLAASVGSVSVLSQTHGMDAHLTLRLTPSATCSAGLPNGVSGTLAVFTTAASPYVLAAGESMTLCLEVTLDASAPSSVRGGTASFRMNVDAVQVRQ